jgi:hypothetical protein
MIQVLRIETHSDIRKIPVSSDIDVEKEDVKVH